MLPCKFDCPFYYDYFKKSVADTPWRKASRELLYTHKNNFTFLLPVFHFKIQKHFVTIFYAIKQYLLEHIKKWPNTQKYQGNFLVKIGVVHA